MLFGSMLNDPSVLNLAISNGINSEILTPNGGKIYKVILENHANGKKITKANILILAEKKYKGLLNSKDFIVMESLYKLNKDPMSIINLLKEAFIRDSLLREIKNVESAIQRNVNVEKILQVHRSNITGLENLHHEKGVSVSKIIDITASEIKRGNSVIKYNIPYLDDFAGGLTKGEVTALGGRPGDGKSTLALFIAKTLVKSGRKVLLLNRELTNEASIRRLIVMESNSLTINDLRKETISNETKEEIDRMIPIIKNKYQDLLMVDNVKDLVGALSEIRKHRPDVFIDDYIQMIKTEYDGMKDRRFIIEDIMFSYKWLVKELDITGIILSQLNRDIEKRIDKTPVMSDLAEGASIEHFSETVMFIRQRDKLSSYLTVGKSRWGRPDDYLIGSNLQKCKYYTTVEEAIYENDKGE